MYLNGIKVKIASLVKSASLVGVWRGQGRLLCLPYVRVEARGCFLSQIRNH